MSCGNVLIAIAAAAGTATAGEVINFQLADGQQAMVGSGPTGIAFGVEGRVEVDVQRSADGQIANAGLVGANLQVLSAAVYDFGALGLVTLSNIGITLARPGGQEYFFNEATADSPIGDFAGFLDTGAIADLTGTIEVDTDRDGQADTVNNLADTSLDDRTFDFEGLIMRDRGSNEYQLVTNFSLSIEVGLNGQPVPIDISFDGEASGRIIPTPGSVSLVGLVFGIAFRRRR
ncbi:MAG: hypothetical protein AAF297_05465 [Planctomycetota bacterium]